MLHEIESFDQADDANIPVDIWLEKYDETEEDIPEDMKYVLRAGNYMPMKERVEGGFIVYSDNLAELQEIIKTKILPLYEVAVNKITDMIELTELTEVISIIGVK